MLARLAAVLLAALAAGCATLPPLDGRVESRAMADTAATRLGRGVAPVVAVHPGRSGVHPLSLPIEAFAARVLLADAADRTLDVQYYLWHDDETGTLMLEALWRAAARGVRVRLLLDDITASGQDARFAALDAHPNVEVRLYNPFVHRDARALDFIADFERVNRRMHNKSFTADNQVAIVGGRNVGNEYYGAGEGVEFTDLDVVAVGPVVRDVSAAFDLYWNSPSAYPIASLVPPPADGQAMLEAAFAATRADPDAAAYREALRDSPQVRELVGGRLPFEWTAVRVVRDEPGKTLDTTDDNSLLLLATLLPAIGEPRTSSCRASAGPRSSRRSPGAACACASSPIRWRRPTWGRSTPGTPSAARRCCARACASTNSSRWRRRRRAARRKASREAAPAACTRRPSRSTTSTFSSGRSISTRAQRASTPRWAS